MNKRIRELVKQATLSGHMLGESYVQSRLDEQKFAELIVKECSNVAWQHTPETEELEYSHLIKDKILAHFGVEE